MDTKHDIPSTRSFTKDEIEGFCKIMKTLPTYRAEDDSIDWPVDGPAFYTNVMKWPRTQEQFDAYTKHVGEAFGGRLSLDQYRKYFTAIHNKAQLFRVYVNDFDTDKDGFISKEELETSFRTITAHDPSIPMLSYEEVLKQADENRDGKLSCDELVTWLKNVTEHA